MKPCLLEKFVWHLILSMDKTPLRSTSRHQFQFPSHPFHGKVWSSCVLMATSVSRQDEPNPALWLATRAEKMELSCPLGISRLVSQDQRSFLGVLSHIINPLLTKLVWSRWLDLASFLTDIQPSWPHAWSITHIYWTGDHRKIHWTIIVFRRYELKTYSILIGESYITLTQILHKSKPVILYLHSYAQVLQFSWSNYSG